jgi:predicted alpha/beta-fold hydrolase
MFRNPINHANNKLPATAIALILATGLLAVTGVASVSAADHTASAAVTQTQHKTVNINGVDIFYREAGSSNAPTILLLHGFPTSSHMFRNLIPALSDRFHVVAPDYSGFGNSAMPGVEDFDCGAPTVFVMLIMINIRDSLKPITCCTPACDGTFIKR